MSIVRCIFIGLLSGFCMSATGTERIPLAGEVGSTVPSFQMRTVSGSLMNRSVCHVCRNGDRPVVMVVLRELNPQQRVLLRNIDRVVEKYREQGLRAFAVYLSDVPRRDVPRVQTFQYNGRIVMPVGISLAVIGEDQLGVEESIPVSVILYDEQTVWKRFDFEKDGPSHEQIRKILDSADTMLAESEVSDN
ncbi:MAG: hypothetical protein P8M30_09285 [Planctomycetaceae bacterium]|jgi:hypothetical protein|nr:hypothetical protein [Planctomycetaceae bacterium]